MRKKLAVMMLLIVVVNILTASISLAADVRFPWSIQLEETQTTVIK